MSKVQRSVLFLAASSIVVCAVALALVHANQSILPVKVVPKPLINTSAVKPDTVSNWTSHSSGSAWIVNPSTNQENLTGANSKDQKFSELKDKYHLLSIPTYDHLGQLTHPKVLYFANGWNGYHYWMSMTPYPFTRDKYENPSIVVSNDGEKWKVPVGLKNPVSGLPKDIRIAGHYSDPHLVMNGNTMELWYRYNPGNAKTHLATNHLNIYLRKTSTDGVHWSQSQELFHDRDGHLSAAAFMENGVYKEWYSDYYGRLFFSQSENATSWSKPVTTSVPLPKGYHVWHQDVIKVGTKYCLLQCAQLGTDTYAEFFASSSDGVNFSNVKRIYPTANVKMWNNVCFYRSSMLEKDGKMELYLSCRFPGKRWYITHQTSSLQSLLAPQPNFSIVSGLSGSQITDGTKSAPNTNQQKPKGKENQAGEKSMPSKVAQRTIASV